MIVVLQTLNSLLATAMWFILGRLCLRLFIRNTHNPVWQLFLTVTEPLYRVSRTLTGERLSERWYWLVSLVWILIARYVITRVQISLGP